MQQDISKKVNPSELRHFIRHVCMAGKENKEREEPGKQIKKTKKIPFGEGIKKENMEKQPFQLNEKTNLEPQKENKLLKYAEADENTARHLTEKIKTLEKDLSVAETERDKARTGNKEEIRKLAESIAGIRSSMRRILKEKRYREKRTRELEEKIKKSAVKHPSP